MKNSWAQPSLSRDFALLSAAILFVLLLISIWVAVTTYARHTETIIYDLEKEAVRIEYRLDAEIERAGYLLNAIGHQIVLHKETNLLPTAQLLKSFDNSGNIYSIFSWTSAQKEVLVSSNSGILDKPVDVSDREYVKKALAEPWRMQIAGPIQGRLSDRWVIPVALGISDNTGKTLGLVMVSLDINTLSEQISQLVRREGISFAIVSKNLIPLTQVSSDKDFLINNFSSQKLIDIDFNKASSGLLSRGNLFWGTGNYSYYRVSADYPYVILLGYDAQFSDEQVRRILWSRLLEIIAIAGFLLLLMWIVRVRVIRPVLDMTEMLGKVAVGEVNARVPNAGAEEINGLGREIERVGQYIAESKRVEDELRHKMAVIKQSKEQTEIKTRGKSEYLAYLCQELRQPLSAIISGAQALKDQLYGPLENRKYRQYAAEIFDNGNQMMSDVQSLLSIGKLESNYICIAEKPLDIGMALQKALHFMSDKIQEKAIIIRLDQLADLPRLVGDDFRFQQILTNLLLHIVKVAPQGAVLTISAMLSSDNKEKAALVIRMGTSARPLITDEEITRLAGRTVSASAYSLRSHEEPAHIELEYARVVADLHGGAFEIRQSENVIEVVIVFNGARLDYSQQDD